MDRDLLIKAGVAAYGERWKTALAKDLGVSRVFMQKLIAGDEKIPRSFPVRLACILEKKLKYQRHILNQLKTEGKV